MKGYDVILLDITRMPGLLQLLRQTDLDVRQITDQQARLLGIQWEVLGFVVTLLTPECYKLYPKAFRFCSDDWASAGNQSHLQSISTTYADAEGLPMCVSVDKPYEYGHDAESNEQLHKLIQEALTCVMTSVLDVFGGEVISRSHNESNRIHPRKESVQSLNQLMSKRLLTMEREQ